MRRGFLPRRFSYFDLLIILDFFNPLVTGPIPVRPSRLQKHKGLQPSGLQPLMLLGGKCNEPVTIRLGAERTGGWDITIS